MRSSDFPEIRALPLFSGMDAAHFEALMRGGYVQSFPPSIELISEGEPSDFLHVVVEGSVELFAGWNGRETTMATVEPVSTFILAATIRDAPYLMSGRTVERSRVVLIPSEDVRAIFDADNAFARAVVQELAQCYRGVIKSAKNMKLRNSVERLANYLLSRHDALGGSCDFEFAMEKRRVASILGMTPENMSRALRTLQPYGVTVDGMRVRLSDPEELRRFAKPTPLIDDPAH